MLRFPHTCLGYVKKLTNVLCWICPKNPTCLGAWPRLPMLLTALANGREQGGPGRRAPWFWRPCSLTDSPLLSLLCLCLPLKSYKTQNCSGQLAELATEEKATSAKLWRPPPPLLSKHTEAGVPLCPTPSCFVFLFPLPFSSLEEGRRNTGERKQSTKSKELKHLIEDIATNGANILMPSNRNNWYLPSTYRPGVALGTQ